jgi:NarL family two-component system response regulator LiaR
MTRPITILICDDHAMVRHGIRSFLETQPGMTVVAEADSGDEAVRLAAEHRPDAVLMDLVMPGTDGVEAIRRIATASPASATIALTSYESDEYIFPAIRAGAASYLLKNVTPEELADAVRRTVAGEAVLDPRVAGRLVRELNGARAGEPNAFRELSDRELEVLRLIADGESNSAIAARLHISEKTVKSHVGAILAKLQVADRTQAAVYAWRHGVVRGDANRP